MIGEAAFHAAHRARLQERLAPERAAGLFFSGEAKVRNHDSEYRFRPESDFWYLTGLAEPQAALLVLPCAPDRGTSVLFLRERVAAEETWTGRRLGVDAAPARLGVDRAFPIGELWLRLPGLLAGHAALVYAGGTVPARDAELHGVLARLRAKTRTGVDVPSALAEPAATLHELRLFKSEAELARMRRAAAISAEAHVAAMRAAQPGTGEGELDGLLAYTFRRRDSTGPAYNNIVAGGANACVLHYNDNDAELRAGELVLIDAGAEWEFYASDVTRTTPVGGCFSPEQRALYELVLAAQQAAIAEVRPGRSCRAPHEAAVRVLAPGLARLGLVADAPERAAESDGYKRFFMHRTSHWLGLDVHDCGAYFAGGKPRPFEAGMVTTVEPGVYVAPDDESVEPRWRGIGIRIEDDVLVTERGCEVLTEAIPKDPDELERLSRPTVTSGELRAAGATGAPERAGGRVLK